MSETLGVRRAEDGDVAHVSDLVNARPEAYLERFGTVAVEQVVEKHFLSVVFTETDGRVVGLAAFNDSPRPGQEADEWVDWSRRTFGQDFLTVGGRCGRFFARRHADARARPPCHAVHQLSLAQLLRVR